MTPLHIRLMLHYYAIASEYEPLEAKATQEYLTELVNDGLLKYRVPNDYTNSYEATERGKIWVQMILNTPYPQQEWVDPRNQDNKNI